MTTCPRVPLGALVLLALAFWVLVAVGLAAHHVRHVRPTERELELFLADSGTLSSDYVDAGAPR